MEPLAILVRHGESELNLINKGPDKVATGRIDVPLTPKGEGEAREAGIRIARIPLALAVCSPLIRARRTAELALAQHPHPPTLVTDGHFTERGLGTFEGMRLADIRTSYPEYFSDPALMQWRMDFEQHAPEGENMAQVEDRVLEGYESLCTECPQENFVIFSHIVAIRSLLRPLLHLSREEAVRLPVPNATPLILARTPVPHLIGEMTLDALRAREKK